MHRLIDFRLHPWHWLGALALALALALPAVAMAQAPGLSAADRADIKNFTLNQDVFNRLKAVMTEGRAMHIKRHQMDMSKVHSLSDMASQMVQADPRIKPLLAKHGFTPRQFLVANMALVTTVQMVRYGEKTGRAKAMESQLNPANVRFYQQHKAAIDKLMNPAAASSQAPQS
jgi:hypothetical protein